MGHFGMQNRRRPCLTKPLGTCLLLRPLKPLPLWSEVGLFLATPPLDFHQPIQLACRLGHPEKHIVLPSYIVPKDLSKELLQPMQCQASITTSHLCPIAAGVPNLAPPGSRAGPLAVREEGHLSPFSARSCANKEAPVLELGRNSRDMIHTRAAHTSFSMSPDF